MRGLYCAVARKTRQGKPAGGWLPEQAVSLEDALRHYTIDGAYASFEEKDKGSLTVGKYADLVVMSDDIFKGPPEGILARAGGDDDDGGESGVSRRERGLVGLNARALSRARPRHGTSHAAASVRVPPPRTPRGYGTPCSAASTRRAPGRAGHQPSDRGHRLPARQPGIADRPRGLHVRRRLEEQRAGKRDERPAHHGGHHADAVAAGHPIGTRLVRPAPAQDHEGGEDEQVREQEARCPRA